MVPSVPVHRADKGLHCTRVMHELVWDGTYALLSGISSACEACFRVLRNDCCNTRWLARRIQPGVSKLASSSPYNLHAQNLQS
eukprot:2958566-Amphidinium_carterae.1